MLGACVVSIGQERGSLLCRDCVVSITRSPDSRWRLTFHLSLRITPTRSFGHTQRGGDIASALQIRWAHELGKVGLAIDQSQRTGRRDRMEVTAPAWGGGVGGVNQQIGRIYLQSRGI